MNFNLILSFFPEHAGMDEKIDAEYSGMIEPPLIKQLKRILSEYPDNGQIIKVSYSLALVNRYVCGALRN